MNIKILICFIIICSIPAASAANNVWVAKSSGFIKSNGSISFENYIVRATPLDASRASVTVYRGQTRIETSEFGINEFKVYDAAGITLLGINGDSAWVSISKLENKDFWRPLAAAQLKWGEKYTIENHTFSFDTFGSDSVNLTVSNQSTTETKLFSVDAQKDYGTLRMLVRNINRTGFIDLEFYTNRPPIYKTEVFPRIRTEIQTDKSEYFPDEPVQVSIIISSDLPLNIVGANFETSPSAGILPENLSTADASGTISLKTGITGQPVNSTLSIRAKIEIRDYYNNSYSLDVSKNIFITPEVALTKYVQADTDDGNVPVQLYVRNSAAENRSIRIYDSIPAEIGAKEMNWTVELGAKNSTTIEYNVTPQRPGLYFLPAAVAQWNGQSAMSKKMKMTMHMPYLRLTKTAEINNSQTNVKLVASNIGDRPAQVEMSDRVPAGRQIARGETSWSGKLESGASATLTYSLNAEVEILPAGSANYRDIRGVVRSVQSNRVDPRNIDPGNQDKRKNISNTVSINLEPKEILMFMVASFMAIAGTITGAALMAYIITRIRS